MKKFIVALVLAVVAVAVGIWFSPGVTTAEVRAVAPQEHFQSGGERSIAVLKEIVAALDRVEKRLERIETAVRELKREPNPVRLP